MPRLLAAVLALGAGLPACGPDHPVPAETTASRYQHGATEGTSTPVGPDQGRWHAPRPATTDAGLTDEQAAEIERLQAIGYASGVHPGDDRAGVTRIDPERVSRGLMLFTSAHAPTAMLIDVLGRVVHRWYYDFQLAFPELPGTHKSASFWRAVHLFGNGDLIAIFDGLAIIKLDKDSNLLWARHLPAHHALSMLEDGSFWVLTRQAHVVPRVDPEQPVLEDFVSLLDPEGNELRSVSVLEALEHSDYADLYDGGLGINGDLFHTNSLEWLDGRLADANPAFRRGNLLISSRHLDMIAVLDPDRAEIVWAATGAFNAQHDVASLDNGHLLLFDNNPLGEASRVVELDPADGSEHWVYQGSAAEPFYSETCGRAQRQPGGNTLITESDFGRAFEVTAAGEIVWEFYNPFRAGDEGEYIATMMEMTRLPPDFPLDWLEPGSEAGEPLR